MDKTQTNEVPQTFPHIAINVNEQGAIISLMLAPGIVLNQALSEDAMNQITKRWIETRKEVKKRLELVQNVIRTRND